MSVFLSQHLLKWGLARVLATQSVSQSRSRPIAYSSSLMSTASSDDEFSAYNFSEFTEEDLQRIDAEVARMPHGGPQITIQVEAEGSIDDTIMSQTPHASESHSKGKQIADSNSLSPMARYRKNGTLSVTDLTSLAWCEVQVDYGLRQMRHLPIAKRPKSFMSARGNEITVTKEVAVKNDVRTKRGKALHKKLEREVKPEELYVETASAEERWALRLVNMIASLRGMSLEGYTRELPVFGILQGQLVVGVIDEVRMVSSTGTTPQKRSSSSPARSKSKKLRPSLSPSQHLVTDYFFGIISAHPHTPVDRAMSPILTETEIERPSTPEELATTISPSRRFLHLLDTKTRQTDSLPPKKDTLPSRLQLMLYYRLLEELISRSSPFDFAALWKRVGVEPMKPFSTRFLIQAGQLMDSEASSNLKSSCLNDLSKIFVGMVQDLHIAGIDTKLELVYRRRQGATKKGEVSRGGSMKRNASPVVSQEERDLAKAIEASLVDARASGEPAVQASSTEVAVQLDPTTSGDTPSDTGTPTVGSKNTLQRLVVSSNGEVETSENTPRPLSSTSSSETEAEEEHASQPIGNKLFNYDATMLDRHIAHALRWWRGDRNPQGVSEENAGRCSSCEYQRNCEWREQKALERGRR